MCKEAFLLQLRKALSGVPADDLEERVVFYSEMIDDRIEEGLSEEDAVSAVGPVEAIAKQILADIPLTKLAKERVKPIRQLRVWEMILLILGFPVWGSLLISAIAVVLSLYVSLWSVVISLWAVFVSLIACAAAGIVAGIGFVCIGNTPSGIVMIGGALVCAGLSVFLFYGCHWATKGISLLAKLFLVWIKGLFIRKEEG